MAYSFPRPRLVKIQFKDVWNPLRGRRTLADLTREGSAAVSAAINLKFTTALFDAKIWLWCGSLSMPRLLTTYCASPTSIYKEAVMFMMYRIGAMQSLMDGHNHPCLYKLNGYEETLNDIHIHVKLVVELNMDSINVHVKAQA